MVFNMLQRGTDFMSGLLQGWMTELQRFSWRWSQIVVHLTPCAWILPAHHLTPLGALDAIPGTPEYLSSLSVLNVTCIQNSFES